MGTQVISLVMSYFGSKILFSISEKKKTMKKRVSQVGATTFGPRRDKTCLRGSRQKRDSNQSPQL